MRVYLDDERATPSGWKRVYWPDEAIELLRTGEVSEISLDHDLGDDLRGTGYDVILWIEEAVATRGFTPPTIKVHSANSSAREEMENGIRAIEQLRGGDQRVIIAGPHSPDGLPRVSKTLKFGRRDTLTTDQQKALKGL